MVDSLESDNVFKEDKGSLHPGRFKANQHGIVFKSSKTGKLDSIAGNEVLNASWQRLAAAQGLRLATKNGGFYRFGGFGENDYEKFQSFFREHYSINLREREFCLKGWNWGVANFQGSVLNFDNDRSTVFEVPLTNVSHCTSTKNEVTLEFHSDEGPVSLMELRFHIPNATDSSADDPVQTFVDNVMAKADIIQATGDAIVTFSELHCLTPRGRYDIKLFPTFIQLHGKTFDYKIPLTTVLRLFRLPHKDNRQVFFVLSLDPPIKQGQTRYHFLILNFNKEDETRLELNVQDDSKEKFHGLDRVLEGPTIELIGKVMKALVQRKITQPAENFCGTNQLPVITCSYKSSIGLLYPLDRGFIFVHKPAIHVRHEEIAAINFARGGSSTRSFDLEIETKNGTVHIFSSIEKEEYTRLFNFIEIKKLRIKNTPATGTAPSKDKDDDDDMQDSDEEDERDAYLHRVKQEGRERNEDSDESDESFNPDAGSGGSDVAEEFDSDASASPSGSDAASDGTPKKKKKTEKQEKPRKKAKKEKKEKKKSKKQDSDPNKPKKPLTAYFLWAQENRDKVKAKYPELKGVTDVSRKLGELWKEVSDKSKWEKEANRLQQVYKKEMADYKSQGSSSQQKSSKKSKESSSPQKGSFKSREFVSDDSSSSDESEKKKKKNKKKKKKEESSDDGSRDSGDSE